MLGLLNLSVVLSSTTETRPFELYSVHQPELQLASNGKSLFFTDEKTIMVNEYLTNFLRESTNIIWAGDYYFCPHVQTGKTLELCKYSVEGIHFKIADKPNNEAQIIATSKGKCLGYDFQGAENKTLHLVECTTGDFETRFQIKYLDETTVSTRVVPTGKQMPKDEAALNKGFEKTPTKESKGGDGHKHEKPIDTSK